MKLSKGAFAQRQIEYLGHMVSGRSVKPVQEKILAIQQQPSPTSLHTLRGFLGLTGFYRRFIRGYAAIAAPLVHLLTKDTFEWSTIVQDAIQALKTSVNIASVLPLPDFSLPFTLETDASRLGLGVVLSQQHHPIAFFSKQFCPRLQQASTYVHELCTITSSVKKWRQYLLGHPFMILTDHRSLKELMSQNVQMPEQHMYLTKLMGYDFPIQYRSSLLNRIADALSRVPEVDKGMVFWL